MIGGGHNGLITAAYLARAGKKVCLLERRSVLGGACTTELLWPGYKVSTAAYVVSLLLPEIISQLRLKEYGLNILPRNPSSFTPLPDGRSLLLGPNQQANCQALARFSKADAEALPRYEALLDRVARSIEPLLSQTAPDPLPWSRSWRQTGLGKKLRDFRGIWKMHQLARDIGEVLPEAIEFLAGAARPILERWFETEVLRATLATDGIIGGFASPSSPGTAYGLLHHVIGSAGGQRGVWGYVQGGMGALSESIAAAGRELGVEIRREAEVAEILISAGRAVGVLLSDGSELASRSIASSADAHVTFERLVSEKELPPEFLAAVRRIDYSSASAKINLALAEPPQFSCTAPEVNAVSRIGPHHHATMHIAPDLEFMERAYDDAKYGQPSRQPILEITLPTSVDPTIAPEGKHLMSMFVQYAPYQLAEGNWDEIKESFADRCVELLAQYAPNVPAAIEHRQVLSPLDLERTFSLTGGNIFQGAMSPHQLFCFRPVPGWSDHRTPIGGLYLCGAASHPGGGVMGACGRNAAFEILRDL